MLKINPFETFPRNSYRPDRNNLNKTDEPLSKNSPLSPNSNLNKMFNIDFF